MASLTINELTESNTRILELIGSLDVQTCAALDEKIPSLSSRVVFDMTQVDFISSAGLRSILYAFKKLQAERGSLILCGLQPSVRRLFDLSGFLTFVTVRSDRAAAVAG